MSHALKAALANLRSAEHQIEAALKNDYPVGSSILWARGGYRHVGTVVRHGYIDRIKVRNDLTEKEYWIHASDIEVAP